MTNEEIIQAIKAEIERQIAEHEDWSSFYHSRGKHSDFEKGAIFALDRMLHFIDNLCGEKSARQRLAEWSKTPEGRESYEKVAEEMRQVTDECGGSEIQKDLDEAAEKYSRENPILPEQCNDGEIPDFVKATKEVYKAGANWQKEQYHFFNEAWADNMQYQLDRNYENGKQAMKDQMMKEAVDGEVDFEYFGYKVIRPDLKQLDTLLESMNHGDKVRIIVCKKED